MNQDSFAAEIHAKYKAMEGSEQVALLYSIQCLANFLSNYKLTKILELGGGIGTLTEVLLKLTNAEVLVVENNQYCRTKLNQNLLGHRAFELIEEYKFLSNDTKAEMLIIDVNNGIFNVKELILRESLLRVIFIEGHHLAHRLNISRTLLSKNYIQEYIDLRPSRGVKGCCFFHIKPDKSPLNWRSKISFCKSYLPLLLSYRIVRFRHQVGRTLDTLSIFPGMKKFRSIWKGKIPWNF
jgi:hypothetical protein